MEESKLSMMIINDINLIFYDEIILQWLEGETLKKLILKKTVPNKDKFPKNYLGV